MKRYLIVAVGMLFLCGCTRYTPIEGVETEEGTEYTQGKQGEAATDNQSSDGEDVIEINSEIILKKGASLRPPVKVKGVYVSAYAAGTKDMMASIIQKIDETELNAVVIDFKDDDGRITCRVDSEMINELEASKVYIGDMAALIQELKAHDIYVIARVVAFRDPYLAEKKPEWSIKTKDGTIYKDSEGFAWVNPYKEEVWQYLAEVGRAASRLGFDEVQFDYIRFATDKTIKNIAYEDEITKGRTKTDVITEFTTYICKELEEEIYVSADVFGAIIGSDGDAQSVGQNYGDMADHLDYICPMIYPSHYGQGNFGIEYPDTQPYGTVLGALKGSKEELNASRTAGRPQAVVRPWLQDFTASYMKNHIDYGPEQVREQINGVYDAGYEEWILWNASCKYSWDGLSKATE